MLHTTPDKVDFRRRDVTIRRPQNADADQPRPHTDGIEKPDATSNAQWGSIVGFFPAIKNIGQI